MAFAQNQGAVKASLTYEDKIAGQISQALQAFNDDNVESMRSTIDALLIMVPQRLYDSDFKADLLENDAEWEDQKKIDAKKHMREMRNAVCPDVLDAPSSTPPRSYWEKKFVSIVNLFDRKGIALKLKTFDSVVDDPS